MNNRDRIVFGVVGEEADILHPERALESGGHVFVFSVSLPDLTEEYKSMPSADDAVGKYFFDGEMR